ncbi:MAG TPA: hypothetical protein DCF33_07840 [Saprospirales bacterium]|nr:hypothetical protein [Saprospirales bacterium]
MKHILGISAFYHDAAAAVVAGGKVLAAAQEERFTRKKHTPDFPVNAIQYCLEASGLQIDDLDAVVFYDKPLLKFERLLQTYYAFAPRGLRSFLQSMPVWLNEKVFLKKAIYNGLRSAGPYNQRRLRLLFTEHHLAHAASAFYVSPFEHAATLTIDGVGEWCTSSIGSGSGHSITLLKEMTFPHSVGLLYSAFTYFLGFTVNSGEYKLMGLAAYGHLNDPQTQAFIQTIKTHLADLKPDGSIWLDQRWFSYATGLRMVPDKKWQKLFGFPRRTPDAPLEQHHGNLALAIQTVTEEIVFNMASEAKRITGAEYLCMAGGVALNSVANGKLMQTGLFKDIYIQPAAGDAGGALGAALAASHLYFGEKRVVTPEQDSMQGACLGPWFSDKEIEQVNLRHRAVYTRYEDSSTLCNHIADHLANGRVVGWFQGRMEFGPRALGNRSILADARNPEMQQMLNSKIKFRESFRPFAPAVMEEDMKDFFDLNTPSPYMLMVAPVQPGRQTAPPEQYHHLPLRERLNTPKSDVPAITHVDGSARVQTVNKLSNPKFYALLQAFKQRTGYGLLVNTSFNVRGEPIVCTPQDAYQCFMETNMDCLVMENYVYLKQDQPDWQNATKWKRNFQTD